MKRVSYSTLTYIAPSLIVNKQQLINAANVQRETFDGKVLVLSTELDKCIQYTNLLLLNRERK